MGSDDAPHDWIGLMKRLARKLFSGDAKRAAIPVFFATMAMEYLVVQRNRKRVEPRTETDESNVEAPIGYEQRDTLASLTMGTGSLVIGAAFAAATAPVERWLFGRRLFSFGTGRAAFAAAIIVWDFLYYWEHRWSHESRVMWAAHVNHHSSERYNLSTALRQSWTGPFVAQWVFFPMLLAGFSPAMVARAGQLNLLYQYWVHTETVDRMPFGLERVMNSASHHRVHHGSNAQYLDKNYAGIFITWDRWFGTFEPEDDRVQYGLTKNIETFNPIKVAFHEWAAIARDVRGAASWSDRFGYVFGPPGWAPASLR